MGLISLGVIRGLNPLYPSNNPPYHLQGPFVFIETLQKRARRFAVAITSPIRVITLHLMDHLDIVRDRAVNPDNGNNQFNGRLVGFFRMRSS